MIARKFEVSLSLASIGALLARLGLTAQKPLQQAYQRDPVAVKHWQEHSYPYPSGQPILSSTSCAATMVSTKEIKWTPIKRANRGAGDTTAVS